MTDDQKRAAFGHAAKWELLAGLFGWVWIVGGLATLAFVAVAFFGNGSWWNAGYAFLASSIGKWLARGFEDHKRRVFFEAQMMAEGMSAKEAGAAWTRAYMGVKQSSFGVTAVF